MGLERERSRGEGGGSATREKIRSIGSALRVRDQGDYIFEWAFQIPPLHPNKGYKKDIATKSLDFSRLFCFLPLTRIVTRKRY